jgi:hypothetical protein
MGLDKLKKKKKKKPHQLVKKRKDGKRPGYYGPDEGFGDYDDSPSSSGGGGGSSDNGGGYDYEYVAYNPPAPAPAPTPEPEYDTADFAFTTPSPSPQPDISGDDQEEDVAQMMVSMGITPDNAPTVSTLPDAEDDGESLYTKTIQINPVDEFGIKGSVYANTGFTPVSGPNVTYDTIANLPPPQPKGFFDSGIGKLVKTVGTVAAPILAPAFLPASLAKGYTTYNQAKTIANLANKVGLTDRTLPTLTELAKYNKNPGTGFKDNTFQSDSDDRPIPKDVITANVQKFSPKFNPEQINKAITFRDQLQSYAEIGRLNEKGQLTLQQLNNLIEQYQVSV